MAQRKIVDDNGTEWLGDFAWIKVVDDHAPACLTDKRAEGMRSDGGDSRDGAIEALLEAERTNAARTATGRRAHALVSIYGRESYYPGSDGAWRPLTLRPVSEDGDEGCS